MRKEHEIYNDYQEWIKRGEKVDKEAYQRIMEYKPFYKKVAEELENFYYEKDN